MPENVQPSEKSRLRRMMRRLIRELSGPPPEVWRHAAGWLAGQDRAQVVALFAPLPGEPDLLPLLSELDGRVWCFPRVVNESRIAFHPVAGIASLREGSFGILEPASDAAVIDPREIDVFLCPGLAFDRDGGRLGRGRGYYDRLLAMARPDALKAGVCFDVQIVASVHAEPHDMRMDAVVTESGVAGQGGGQSLPGA